MKKTYMQPQTVALVLSTENLICASPAPGSNENVGYEDWNI